MTSTNVAAIIFAAIYPSSIAAAWLVPGMVKRWWVKRQDRLLALMRAHYVLGEAAVLGGLSEAAERAAAIIEALDRRWQHGNSRLARAFVGLFALAAGVIAFMMLRTGGLTCLSMMAQGKRISDALPDHWSFLALGPLGATHGVSGFYTFDDWRNLDEPYGLDQRLRQMLAAGRTLALPAAKLEARSGRKAARELFGLGEPYTRKALDQARRHLVRQHHPDLWANAPASEQRAHEAAMKRINAAYELLIERAT